MSEMLHNFGRHRKFSDRHLGSTAKENAEITKYLGEASIEALAKRAVPKGIRIHKPLNLPKAAPEQAAISSVSVPRRGTRGRQTIHCTTPICLSIILFMRFFYLPFILSQAAFGNSFFYGLNTFPEGQGVKCEWKLFNPSTNSEKVLTKFSHGCPDFFFLDSGNGKFYYIEDQKLVAADKRDFSKKETWALPAEAKPPEGGSLFPARLWRDKTSQKIRFAFFDSNPTRIKTAVKSKETRTYAVTYQGKSIGDTFAMGSMGAAVSYELDGVNWKLIEAQATNAEACDTVGLGVLKIEPSTSILSHHVDKSSFFLCTGDRECIKKISPDIQKLISIQFKEAGIYVLNTVKGWALINPESEDSEYSNPGFPAFLYSPVDKKLIPVTEIEKNGLFGLTLSSKREWFTIGTDRRTRIYHYDNAKPQKIIDGFVTGEMWVED